jgi:hypothetical protein
MMEANGLKEAHFPINKASGEEMSFSGTPNICSACDLAQGCSGAQGEITVSLKGSPCESVPLLLNEIFLICL